MRDVFTCESEKFEVWSWQQQNLIYSLSRLEKWSANSFNSWWTSFFLTSLSFLMCIWFEIKIAKVVCRPYGKIPATDLWPFIFASSNTPENALIICEYLMVLSTLIYINLIDWVRFVVIYCIPSDHILRLTHTIRTSANHLSIFYLANKSTLWRHQPQLCEFIFFLFSLLQ